jgi:hypothetical protein
MVIYPSYAVQALEWQSLQGVPHTRKHTSVSASSNLSIVQQHLSSEVQEKKWLLKDGQHIRLPPTHLDDQDNNRIFSIGDFVNRADKARDLDVQECAVDKQGNRLKLSDQQVQEVQKTGELTVESVLFQNQYHTWLVAPCFYSGSDKIRQSFGEGFGQTLDHAVVYTSDSIFGCQSHKALPNLKGAMVDGLGKALQLLRSAAGQLFVGSLKHHTYSKEHVEGILELAKEGYVQQNLLNQGHDIRRLIDDPGGTNPWQALRQDTTRSSLWEILEEDCNWGTSYRQTDSECRPLVKEASKKVFQFRQDFDRTMDSRRNSELAIDEDKVKISPKAAIKEHRAAGNEWRLMKEQAWIDHLKNATTQDMRDLGPAEADRVMALEIEKRVELEDETMIEADLKEYETSLKRRRPVLSLSKAWRQRKLDTRREEVAATLEKSRQERVSNNVEAEGLHIQSAARKLAIKFQQEEREVLAKCLYSKESSYPPAEFRVLQLNPNNWSGDASTGFNRYKTIKVDLGKPFWRVHYSWMMFVSLAKSLIGGSFHSLAAGPLSLRALLSPSAFYAIERPTRDTKSLTQTLASRLVSFFRTLRQMRDDFEAKPDRGLIGKAIQRFFLKGYMALKAVVGTAAICLFMTVGTAIASTLSAVALASSPVIAAFMSLITMIFNLTIYDTALQAASSRFHNRKVRLPFGGLAEMPSSVSPLLKILIVAPYYLIVPGALQAVLAVLRIGGFHPLVASIQLAWSSLRFALRTFRDTINWFFVRKLSRIPAEDTFLAWRIHGPGLSPTHFYRLPVEAVKASVLLFLDKYRLHAHAQARKAELEAPFENYSGLFRSVLDPFGVGVQMNVSSPRAIGNCIASSCKQIENYRIDPRKYRQSDIHEHVLDIWSAVGNGIRSSHPDHALAQERYIQQGWSSPILQTFEGLDGKIRLEIELMYNTHKSKGISELDELVNRVAKSWAGLTLSVSLRDQRLTDAVAIPTHAAGRFRWTESEQDEIWQFTLRAVEIYGSLLKDELMDIQSVSEFDVQATISHVTDAFYSKSGARPGQDIPTVASFVLVQLLGGEYMLETLEEIDETLVLSPKISPEDEHLVFWKSFNL